MGKSNRKRSELMQQMKLFYKCQIPFDIELGKTELPISYIEKTSDEICEILVNAHLNLDEDLIEIIEEDNGINDAEINSFDKIIKDSLEEDSEKEDNQNVVEKEKETDIKWDPIAAADEHVFEGYRGYGDFRIMKFRASFGGSRNLGRFQRLRKFGQISEVTEVWARVLKLD
ncbi:4946_t:CDS:2 [Funneliformis geosporum]|nr:4946_t:CDS:2 [Funneliformis geosporum]